MFEFGIAGFYEIYHPIESTSPIKHEVLAKLTAVKVATSAELFGIGVTEMLAPKNEGSYSVRVSCQIALLVLAEFRDMRSEFRDALEASLLGRFREAIAKELSGTFELPENTLLPDFQDEDWLPEEEDDNA